MRERDRERENRERGGGVKFSGIKYCAVFCCCLVCCGGLIITYHSGLHRSVSRVYLLTANSKLCALNIGDRSHSTQSNLSLCLSFCVNTCCHYYFSAATDERQHTEPERQQLLRSRSFDPKSQAAAACHLSTHRKQTIEAWGRLLEQKACRAGHVTCPSHV